MISAGDAATVAAASVVAVAAAAGIEVERQVLGVPESVLLVAIAGSLFGAFQARSDELAKLGGTPCRWRLLAKWAVFTSGVAAWGLVAAWLAMIAWHFHGATPLLHPIAGLAGVAIRRVLPRLLSAIDRWIDALGGHKP